MFELPLLDYWSGIPLNGESRSFFQKGAVRQRDTDQVLYDALEQKYEKVLEMLRAISDYYTDLEWEPWAAKWPQFASLPIPRVLEIAKQGLAQLEAKP